MFFQYKLSCNQKKKTIFILHTRTLCIHIGKYQIQYKININFHCSKIHLFTSQLKKPLYKVFKNSYKKYY